MENPLKEVCSGVWVGAAFPHLVQQWMIDRCSRLGCICHRLFLHKTGKQLLNTGCPCTGDVCYSCILTVGIHHRMQPNGVCLRYGVTHRQATHPHRSAAPCCPYITCTIMQSVYDTLTRICLLAPCATALALDDYNVKIGKQGTC